MGPAPGSLIVALLLSFGLQLMIDTPQGVGKWFEGAQGQSVYWAVSNDSGLTWGPTQVMIPSPDTLPLWGPVVHTQVTTGLTQQALPPSPRWRPRVASALTCKRFCSGWLCAGMQGGMCMAVCFA